MTMKERGMATAEYTMGTIGAVMIAVVLYRLGMLDDDNPWINAFRRVLERSLHWGVLRDIFEDFPGFGLF